MLNKYTVMNCDGWLSRGPRKGYGKSLYSCGSAKRLELGAVKYTLNNGTYDLTIRSSTLTKSYLMLLSQACFTTNAQHARYSMDFLLLGPIKNEGTRLRGFVLDAQGFLPKKAMLSMVL
ncbi:unnamed protein product [Sphenostylis stenocarpa]|uniref:Uncharacterized protein n=1 Tax=Sphenostylis stenocarpa TaxID=92480 RepID=A0AA86SDM3_9FABA|nr:unnamed protein product [Sphenostylis stenocarpa]